MKVKLIVIMCNTIFMIVTNCGSVVSCMRFMKELCEMYTKLRRISCRIDWDQYLL